MFSGAVGRFWRQQFKRGEGVKWCVDLRGAWRVGGGGGGLPRGLVVFPTFVFFEKGHVDESCPLAALNELYMLSQ